MSQFTLTLLIFLNSMFLTSCAMNRAKSSRMLEKRASYDKDQSKNAEINGGVVPIQTPAKRTKVYIYPHELPSGDYFLGGYIFAEIEKEKITLKRRKK